MEITLITRNGITPNPTVEFLELCQLAIEALNDRAFGMVILAHKVKELSRSDCWLHFEQTNRYGITTFSIGYCLEGTNTMHHFDSHERNEAGDYEIYPNIEASLIDG
jgi:hypothetical protein